MKVHISFKFINPDFDQAYVDEYHLGKASESNHRYNEAITWEIDNVTSVELINQGTYQYKGKLNDGNIGEVPIPNVVMFRCHLENGSNEDFAVSKSILNKTHQAHNEKYQVTRCYFYINSEPKSIKLGENLVLALNEYWVN